MCDACKMSICPPRCPEYRGRRAGFGSPSAACELCGAPIYKGESHFYNGEIRLCSDCARYISIDEINLICGFRNERELLLALGFCEDFDI